MFVHSFSYNNECTFIPVNTQHIQLNSLMSDSASVRFFVLFFKKEEKKERKKEEREDNSKPIPTNR